MSIDSQQVRSLFLDAVENHTPEQWGVFLDGVCGADHVLRGRVEVLLRAHTNSNRLLDRPTHGLVANSSEPSPEHTGTIVGSYKLMEQVGEGGFGIVFRAEQQQPVRREVAIKILKPGMDSRQVVARFEAERQALALMDHPNIARVLDGGQTGAGRPYFVMDLVRGLPITDYCDSAQLGVRQRLELFLHVCSAVQHAHQKGIIHRDLKPTNVLVTSARDSLEGEEDEAGVVKVIDFGIAKATGQPLTEKTLVTNQAQMVGTPLYMSPEQAALGGLDIDTRTDIYALGVLLYELLTGTTPFDKERLKQASYDEIRRIIREEDPPKPSTRISTLGQAATTASEQRRSDPRTLSQLFRGELDWIVLKCLEKDRGRRYQTASALAADVERYLHDEPVEACPPSTSYRFRKFARRHRTVLYASACVSAALMVACVVLVRNHFLIAALGEKRARALGEAEANFQAARTAVDKYFTLVSSSQLGDMPGLELLRKQFLDTALEYYQGFIDRHTTERDLEAEVAAAHIRVAEITYLAGGSPDRWLPHLRDGVDIAERLIAEGRDTREVQLRLSGLYLGGDPPLMLTTTLERRLEKLRRVSAHGPITPGAASQTATICPLGGSREVLTSGEGAPKVTRPTSDGSSVVIEVAKMPYAEVRTYLQKELSVWEKFIRDNPDVPDFLNDMAGTCYYLATSYGIEDEAIKWCQRAIETWERLARDYPKTLNYRAELARAHQLRAYVLAETDRHAQAAESFDRARTIYQELSAQQPEKVLYKAWLGASYRSLAELQIKRKQLADAEENLHRAVEVQEKLFAEYPAICTYQEDLARTQLDLGDVLRKVDRPREAAAAYRQAIDIGKSLIAHIPQQAAYEELYREATRRLAEMAIDSEKH
jgi:serine/threonine protein kinase/tetratricopeptide (TPR) repeat protein